MKMKAFNRRNVLLGLIGVAMLAAIAFVMVRSGPMAPARVTTVQAKRASFTPTIFGIGTVEARRAYSVGPTAAGRVSAVLVDVGDVVPPGGRLADMDPVDVDERIAAVDASVARARSAVAALEAQRLDVEAKRQVASLNARRYQELGEKNFISASAVEMRVQEHASADASLAAAEANIVAARHDLRRLELERAALQQQRGNLRLAAPAGGIVVSRDAEAGSTVVAGQSVVRLVDPTSLWVRARIDQGRSTGLSQGLPAQIVLRSDPDNPIKGRVARVEALSDSVTEERVAHVEFEYLPTHVAIGELAEVTLALPSTEPAIVVPNASLRRHDGRLGVWRLHDGELAFVPVRIGAAGQHGEIQILDGLVDGDEVIVHSEREVTPATRLRKVTSLADAR
jgi:HlyD family secretion protein